MARTKGKRSWDLQGHRHAGGRLGGLYAAHPAGPAHIATTTLVRFHIMF